MKLLCLVLIGITFYSCLPKTPVYPYTGKSELTINQEAQAWSDDLEGYIRSWLNGSASAEIPVDLLPVGMDTSSFKSFRLVPFEDIDVEKQWAKRLSHPINKDTLFASFPDPNCTYLVMPAMCIPFGAKLIIDGEYPYSRFFDIQVSPSFESKEYRYAKWAGKGEVSIVDTDIAPNDGSINPFVVGNPRRGTNRSYHVEFEMAIGNATELNEGAHQPPYRGGGNKRYASAIQFQGPWGVDDKRGHGRGLYDIGDVWIRYYAIDKDKNALGGVKLPKAYYQLSTGEKFFIDVNFEKFDEVSNATMANRTIGNNHPADYVGSDVGWNKSYGIFLSISSGLSKALYKNSAKDKQYLRDLDLGVTGRGEDQPAPACYEPHATGCNYINYLQRGVSIKKGYVMVLTGKLPTFPDTREGAEVMSSAQCRYFSFTGYDAAFPFAKLAGLEQNSLMDDEIVIDDERKYIIVYSRPEDQPTNAKSPNKVTWVDLGQTGTQAITLRWMSISDDWMMENAPTEENLTWSEAVYSGTNFDESLIETNNHSGYLGWYLPQVHYMTTEEFEKLGGNLTADQIPVWE